MKIYFHRTYICITVLLFLTEVLIALFVRDRFIRPYFGDFLVVILLFTLVRSFFRVNNLLLSLAVLLFSYTVETLQYFEFIKIIGLQKSQIARVLIGNSFAWMDILAYTLGVLAIIGIKKIRFERREPEQQMMWI